jgi:hypothetical protein
VRPCRAEYRRQRYLANKQRYIDQARVRKEILRAGRTEYVFRAGPTYRAWDRILAKIEKCEVVCANCRRRRTAQRRGSWRAQPSANF